jgi:glycosyltransferase involved in cell wall biosynthesis
MKLSILMLSIPTRFAMMQKLYTKILNQIGNEDIEILCLIDNKKRTIGDKRNDLVVAARGEYLTFIDDDDDVCDNYISELVIGMKSKSDVIVFNETASFNGENSFTVTPGKEYQNEHARKVNGRWVDIRRKPWHWCLWKSSIAKTERVPDMNNGEDELWCRRLLPKIQTQHRINKILRIYRFSNSISDHGQK